MTTLPGWRNWTPDELARIGGATEPDIATHRADGSRRRPVPIWIVRVGDDLYVRSYRGAGGAWYRHAVASGLAWIRAGGLARDVVAERPDDALRSAIDDAYQSKYGRSGYVAPMLGDEAVATTLRLMPTKQHPTTRDEEGHR